MFQAVDWQQLTIKALNTFWQAFIAVLVVPADPFDGAAWGAVAMAAIAAGLSAVKTFISDLLRSQQE